MNMSRTQIVIRLAIIAVLLVFIFYTFFNGGRAG